MDGSIAKTGTKPRIFLDDNSLLKIEKEQFNAVQHFNRFPLLKINDIIYYGKIDSVSVLAFICKHVRNDLIGCSNY